MTGQIHGVFRVQRLPWGLVAGLVGTVADLRDELLRGLREVGALIREVAPHTDIPLRGTRTGNVATSQLTSSEPTSVTRRRQEP